jgi:hypothetical protein
VEDVREVAPVLDGDRLVEPVALLEGLHDGGIGGGLLAQVRRHRVSGDELREEECDERDPEAQQDERGRAPQQEADEGRRRHTRESHGRPPIVAAPFSRFQ